MKHIHSPSSTFRIQEYTGVGRSLSNSVLAHERFLISARPPENQQCTSLLCENRCILFENTAKEEYGL